MFVASVVFILGMASSVITAIIAALFLVEIANLMPMERKDKINLVIIACFAIGLGAVLTPLGEPLSTIAVTKLQGAPYNAGFWYLADQLGILIVLAYWDAQSSAASMWARKAVKGRGPGDRG